MENCKISRDLLIEILARLPVRSLMRFKCVCKFFYSLIKSDHHFKHKHYEISRARSDYVIFEREIGVWPWPLRAERVFGLVYKERDSDEIGCVDLPMPNSLIKDVKCADGMLCLVTYKRDDPLGVREVIWYTSIWNPSTREIKELPYIKPHDESKTHYGAVGFGFSSNMSGKVVMIWVSPYPETFIFPIVMVCSQVGNSWAWRQFSPFLHIIHVDNHNDFYLNGKYYWPCTFQEQKHEHLLWFDFTNEVFGKIELPPHPTDNYESEAEIHSWAAVSVMNENITLISNWIAESHVEIWSMNEHNNIISWHKYASLDCNGCWWPMRIWNLGGHLLIYSWKLELSCTENDDGGGYVKHLLSIDLVTQERKIIYNIEWLDSQEPALLYSESLKLF